MVCSRGCYFTRTEVKLTGMMFLLLTLLVPVIKLIEKNEEGLGKRIRKKNPVI